MFTFRWNNNLITCSTWESKDKDAKFTFPISVTLTALRSTEVSSSTTATLLTPSSLINLIASRTLAVDVAAITEVYRLREGSENA